MATNLAAANNNGQIMIGMGIRGRGTDRGSESREGRRQARMGGDREREREQKDGRAEHRQGRQTDGGNWTLSVVASALRLETSFVILARASP